MQEYRKISITRDQVVPIAEKMRKEGRYLVMIHAFLDKDGQPDVSYEYAVDPVIESYHVVGEKVLPSIGEIYDEAARWPEGNQNEDFGFLYDFAEKRMQAVDAYISELTGE